ncbi:MAG: MATE family efflux transporter [Parasporobacterium sp.]|nr:MATE family efflux transporter [Parasporobacterium sp.]
MQDNLIFRQDNLTKIIISLAIPAMLGQLAGIIYNLADTYFISLTDNPPEIAAVTLCMPFLLVVMSIGSTFGIGCNSMAARLLGAGQDEDVAKVSCFCLWIPLTLSIIIGIAGLIFMNPLAVLLGADAENLQYVLEYMKYILIGAPAFVLSASHSNFYRAIGKQKESTAGQILGNAINIVLDYLFIIVFGMGVKGAAIATMIGSVCSVLYYLTVMIRYNHKGGRLLPFNFFRHIPDRKMVVGILKIGIPGGLLTIILSISNIFFNNYIALYGNTAVAEYGVANKIYMVPLMLGVGYGQGICPLLGFNFGAKDTERLKKSYKLSILYGLIIGAAFFLLFFFTAPVTSGLFFREPALVAETSAFLRILVIAVPILYVSNVNNVYFQAIGKAIPSMVIILARNLALFIPMVIIFNSLFGLNGLLASVPVSEYLTIIIGTIMTCTSLRKMSAERT